MLFREFNIIAAAAYMAEYAAQGSLPTTAKWDELTDNLRMASTQQVMAIARGEATDRGDVFEATAKAILGYNGGQGGLALEELANLGGSVLSLGLLAEDQVADRNIRETVVELLEELAERRAQPTNALGSNPAYSDGDLRRQALAIAVDRSRRVPGEAAPESVVDGAQVFYGFIVKTDADHWVRISALQHAAEIVSPGARSGTVVLVAEDFLTFLDPAPAQADPEPSR